MNFRQCGNDGREFVPPAVFANFNLSDEYMGDSP
jgi:hypothetical protein